MLDSILCNQMRLDISRMFHLSRYYYSTISAAGGPPHLHLPSRAAAAHLNLPSPAQLICIRGWCVAGDARGGRGADNWGGECQNCDDRGDEIVSSSTRAAFLGHQQSCKQTFAKNSLSQRKHLLALPHLIHYYGSTALC